MKASQTAIGTALRKSCQAAISRLDGLAPLICADENAEDLHEFRVLTRRTRSLLASIRPLLDNDLAQCARGLQNEMKSLAQHSNRIRDLDVVQDDMPSLVKQLPTALVAGLNECEGVIESERDAALERFVEYLSSTDFSDSLTRCRELAAALDDAPTPAMGETASALANQRIAAIQKRARKVGSRATDLHRLRISVKNLRYLLDFLSPALPEKKGRAALKTLSRTQDALGQFHDLSVRMSVLEPMLLNDEAGVHLRLTAAGLATLTHRQHKKRIESAMRESAKLNGHELTTLRKATETGSEQ